MRPPHRLKSLVPFGAAFAAAVAGLLLVRRAEAIPDKNGACKGPRIVVVATLTERWRHAIEDVRANLITKSDLDRCAALFMEPSGDNLRVHVSLADGRTATREVVDPGALFGTLEALLLLPPTEAQRLEEPAVDPPASAPDRAPPAEAPSPHFEAGFGVMGRIAGAPFYDALGLAAFSQLSLHRWLFGVEARWDATDTLVTDAPPSGFNMQTLALAIDVGVRSAFRGLTVDALVGPEIRIENQEAFGGETAPDGIGGGTSDLRLDLLLRIATPATNSLRFFTQGDFDASPARLRKAHRLDVGLPTLPAWSGGLALGVLWGSS